MPKSHDDAVMPLGDHLEDLRRRLVLALVGLVPALILGLVLGRWILEQLFKPVRAALQQQDLVAQLQAISPTEPFYTWLKVGFVFAVILGSPWILYQLWCFVAPGLYANEKRFVHLLTPLSATLAILSVLFVYFVILPVVLAFFIHFGATLGATTIEVAPMPDGVSPQRLLLLDADPEEPAPGDMWFNESIRQIRIAVSDADGGSTIVLGVPLTADAAIAQQYRINEYIKLVLTLALGFAVAFQIPVVVLLLGWAGIIEPPTLRKYRRHAALGLCVISAVLTPADPLSMFLMAVPLYLLYELGLVMLVFFSADRVSRGFGRRVADVSDTTSSDERERAP